MSSRPPGLHSKFQAIETHLENKETKDQNNKKEHKMWRKSLKYIVCARGTNIAQGAMSSPHKPGNLSSIPGIQVKVEERNNATNLTSDLDIHITAHKHPFTQMYTYIYTVKNSKWIQTTTQLLKNDKVWGLHRRACSKAYMRFSLFIRKMQMKTIYNMDSINTYSKYLK